VFFCFSAFLTCVLQTISCDMCKNRKDLCVYGSGTACQVCKERKVRCSFLDVKRKRKDVEINSEDDEEPTPKKLRGAAYKPSAVKPTVEISGSNLATSGSPVIEMVGLLRELVEGVRELTKVTRGVAVLGTQIYQQNAKLVRLGECQSYLAEKALKGSGSGSEAGESGIKEMRKDKGKGKAEVTEKDETMRSDGGSDSDSDSKRIRKRMRGGRRMPGVGFGNGFGYGKVDRE
jgi:hypothetical protein